MDIPPLLPPDQMPPVVDQPSLERTWRALMGRLGFGRPQLYVALLEAGVVLHLVHVEEVPGEPTPLDVRQVVRTFRAVHADLPGADVSLAFLYCRPGSSVLTPADRRWARGLWSVCRRQGWPVHVASDDDVRVVTPDDLAEAA